MHKYKLTNFSYFAVIIFLISSCGGGGGSSEPTQPTYPAPIINLSSSSSSSDVNQDITLNWSSSNASSCSASGDWEGSRTLSGSETIKIKNRSCSIDQTNIAYFGRNHIFFKTIFCV